MCFKMNVGRGKNLVTHSGIVLVAGGDVPFEPSRLFATIDSSTEQFGITNIGFVQHDARPGSGFLISLGSLRGQGAWFLIR